MDMASLREFWDLVVQVWREGAYGIDVAEVLIALAIFAVFLILRRLLSRLIVAGCHRAAARTNVRIDDYVIRALEGPIRFIPVVMGIFFATSVLEVGEGTQIVFAKLNRSLVALTIFWGFYRLTEPLSYTLMRAKGVLNEAMTQWLIKVIKVVFVALGAATVLELWGIAVGPIIAGLGLFGVALALGAQDMVKNLISGVFILGERRFRQGDWINVEGVVEGTVEYIGFRSTSIRRFDKAPVYVPNADLSDNAMINFSRMSFWRIRWLVGVQYRTSIEQLRDIREGIERYILETEDFVQPAQAPTFVRIDSFSDSSIDILVYCFTRTTVWTEWLAIKENLAYKIKEIVEEAGASFAFPSRSLYLETLPDAPEVFPLSRETTPPPEDAPAQSS